MSRQLDAFLREHDCVGIATLRERDLRAQRVRIGEVFVEIHRPFRLLLRFDVTSGVEESAADIPTREHRQRIELLRPLLLGDGAIECTGGDEKVAVQPMRFGIILIEVDGAAELALAGGKVPFVPGAHERERGVTFGERVVDLHGALGRFARTRHRFVRRQIDVRKRIVGVGQSGIRGGVLRIDLNRSIKICY